MKPPRSRHIPHSTFPIPHSEEGFGILAVIIFSSALLIIATSITTLTLSNYRYQHRSYLADKATAIAEAGAEKAIDALNQPSSTYTGETGTSFGGGTYDVAVANPSPNSRTITVTAQLSSGATPTTRRIKVTLSGQPSSTAAFNYGVQVGNGGLVMGNSSKILGNVYSNGNVSMTSGASGYVQGDVFVAGSSGTMTNFQTNKSSPTSPDGNAHVHTITGSSIGGDAYYQTLTSSTVSGTKHPGSSDPTPAAFPITDSQITGWKADAASGGTQGSVNLTSGSTTLGPTKIVGNLSLSNGAVLTLTGTVWVTGNISTNNSSKITVSSSFGTTGAVLISDGIISMNQSSTMTGNGQAGSYLLAVTTSNANPAFVTAQSSLTDLILYAPSGWINISQSGTLREITGYGLNISQSAIVNYSQGLASVSFTTGPGGRWTVTAWQELH